MGCTHPMGVERFTRPDGKRGVKCPVCKATAYPGESFWRTFWRNLRR